MAAGKAARTAAGGRASRSAHSAAEERTAAPGQRRCLQVMIHDRRKFRSGDDAFERVDSKRNTSHSENTPTGRVEQDDRLTSPQFEARVFDAIAMITGGLPPRDIITQPGRIVRPGTRGPGAEET